MMMKSLALASAVWALAAFADGGSATRFELSAHEIASRPKSLTLTLERLDSQPGDAPIAVEWPDDAEALTIAIPNGVWNVVVGGDGTWHDPRVVIVPAAHAVPVHLYPRADVVGRIEAEGTLPPEMALHLTRSVPLDPFERSVSCPVFEKEFQCVVPAGEYDAVLRAEGFVGHVFAGVRFDAGTSFDLGLVKLVRGRSIILPVAGPKGTDIAKASVIAIPAGAPRSLQQSRGRYRGRGWFQIDGVGSGQYVISARHPSGLTSSRRSVTVRTADLLVSEPLVLSKPGRIHLTIDPPVAGAGRRWSVELEKVVVSREMETVAASMASERGHWTSPPLPQSGYTIVVRDDTRTVYRNSISLEDSDVDLGALVVARRVTGTVRLGDQPLEADIELSSDAGLSAQTRSTRDGTFEVVLPDLTTESWAVQVDASLPAVHRRLTVELPFGKNEVTLDLPSLQIDGVVVDAEEKPVSATVTVIGDSTDYLGQAESENDGTFSLAGLAPGKYQVKADAFGDSSDILDVELSEESVSIKLMTHPQRLLRGRVVSASGPVAGARLLARSLDVPMFVHHEWRADDQGRFTAVLPPKTTEVEIEIRAPGFAYASGRVRYATDELLIRIGQSGGTIFVPNEAAGARTRLYHEGAEIFLSALTREWTVVRHSDGVEILDIEPGAYRFCMEKGPDRRCVDGFLPPHGTLRFAKP